MQMQDIAGFLRRDLEVDSCQYEGVILVNLQGSRGIWSRLADVRPDGASLHMADNLWRERAAMLGCTSSQTASQARVLCCIHLSSHCR
jgi:hypothetical protein